MAAVDDAAPDLRQYLALLARRKVLLVLCTAVVTGVAVVLSVVQSPTYRASAQVLRETQSVDPLVQQAPNADQAQRELNNEIRELESTKVRDAVAKAYSGPLPFTAIERVDAAVVAEDSDVIRVSATGGDPDEVARLVNTYVDTYLRFRTEQQVAVLLETGNAVRPKVEELRKRLAEVSAPLVALDAQISDAPPAQRGELQRQRDARADELAPQVSALQTQLTFYQQQLDKVELSAGIRRAGGLRLLASAEVPSEPVSPKPLRNAGLGFALGLLVGLGAAFARDHLDDTVRDKATLESESQLPTLGVIPRLPRRKGRPLDEVVTISDHASPAAEAYRTLRTSVKFLMLENDSKVFQVTSATAAEGKTLTAMNLAVALTQAGSRTIVVGCDLRRPRLDVLAHAHQGPGLTSVLVGDAKLQDAIERHESVRLAILRTGPLPPDPSEMLGSGRMAAVIQALRKYYDAVILDCPPLLPVSDALILAAYSDATLLVVSEGTSSRRNLARALELLRQVNAPLRGTVLNATKGTGGHQYGYAYTYSQASAPERRSRARRVFRGRHLAGPAGTTAGAAPGGARTKGESVGISSKTEPRGETDEPAPAGRTSTPAPGGTGEEVKGPQPAAGASPVASNGDANQQLEAEAEHQR